MSASTTQPRRRSSRRHSEGAFGRFCAASSVLVVVIVGVPVLLVACCQAGLSSWHPLPGIGSSDEIRAYLDRQLSPTEIAPIALRAALIGAWLVWLAMAVSVVSTLFDAAGAQIRMLPQFGLFAGLGRWISAGLTTFSAVAPSFVSAVSLPTPRPFTISSAAPAASADSAIHTSGEAPTRPGFGRVRQGESIEAFARRTLGDARRWQELWDLNHDQPVGPQGEVWTEAWRLGPGWELRLPANVAAVPETTSSSSVASHENGDRHSALAQLFSTDTTAADHVSSPSAAPTAATGADEHTVTDGESYWSIAESHLGAEASGADVNAYVQSLIDHNAPRLGYADPGMLHPGDVVVLVTPPTTQPTGSAAATTSPTHVVDSGDSYWEIAEEHIGPDAPAGDVVELTNDLVDLNNPMLVAGDPDGDRNYDDDRRMIHPGDTVYLADPASASPLPPALPPPVTQPLPAPSPAVSREDELRNVAAAQAITETAAGLAAVNAAVAAASQVPASQPLPPPSPPPIPAGEGSGPVTATRLLGVTAILAAGAGGAFVARRRIASRGRPHQRPVGLPADLYATAKALLSTDVSDVDWMGMELRWLAQHCTPQLRASLAIEEVQIGAGRDLELAFATTPLHEPPPGWTMVAERIWQLDHQHPAVELEPLDDLPPLLPALVTLGQFDGGHLFVNLEQHRGVNVAGDDRLVGEWVTSAVWEVAAGGVAEHPTVLLVDVDIVGVDELDSVKTVDADAALASFDHPAEPLEPSMFDRRANQWEAWDTTLVVLGPTVDGDAWRDVAARPDVAVIAVDGNLPDALAVVAAGGRVTVPRWNLSADAVGMSDSAAHEVASLLEAANQLPVDDELVIAAADPDLDLVTAAEPVWSNGDDSAPALTAPSWTPPTAPVTVCLLGVPSVNGPAGEIRLSAQPMAALAFLAVDREATLDELRSAIWGDDVDVKPHRLRDLLSELRKAVGVDDVIARVEGHVVRAGPALGCDLDVFNALAARAAEASDEAPRCLNEMLALVEGRPFNYQRSVAQYWRWADLSQQHAIWEHRVATAAYELGQFHLQRNDTAAAMEVAHRGLQADAYNGALTEVLIQAYDAAGAPEMAERVYEAHDRAMADSGFGGASEETRRVLDSIREARRTDAAAAV